jgi:hypothetical protein
MFDKYFIPQSDGNTTKKVIEKRAPTDESIRLLKEFEEKSLNKIIDTIHVENNIISGTAFFVNDDFLTNSKYVYAKFTLNGRKYVTNKKISIREYTSINISMEEYLFDFLIESISKEIARNFLESYCRNKKY